MDWNMTLAITALCVASLAILLCLIVACIAMDSDERLERLITTEVREWSDEHYRCAHQQGKRNPALRHRDVKTCMGCACLLDYRGFALPIHTVLVFSPTGSETFDNYCGRCKPDYDKMVVAYDGTIRYFRAEATGRALNGLDSNAGWRQIRVETP